VGNDEDAEEEKGRRDLKMQMQSESTKGRDYI
jgi:hypothetical protein